MNATVTFPTGGPRTVNIFAIPRANRWSRVRGEGG